MEMEWGKREREKERERPIYFEELAYTTLEAGRSKLCRVGWRAGDPGKS